MSSIPGSNCTWGHQFWKKAEWWNGETGDNDSLMPDMTKKWIYSIPHKIKGSAQLILRRTKTYCRCNIIKYQNKDTSLIESLYNTKELTAPSYKENFGMLSIQMGFWFQPYLISFTFNFVYFKLMFIYSYHIFILHYRLV